MGWSPTQGFGWFRVPTTWVSVPIWKERFQQRLQGQPVSTPSTQALSKSHLINITKDTITPPIQAALVALIVKNLPANAWATGDISLIPGSGRFPGGGHGNPLQYSSLENPMDRGAWRAPVHGATEWDTTEQLSTAHKMDCMGVSTGSTDITLTYWNAWFSPKGQFIQWENTLSDTLEFS